MTAAARESDAPRFDVIGVTIKGGAERVMARNLSAADADAFVRMAVIRRGCDEEFYKAVPAGSVKP